MSASVLLELYHLSSADLERIRSFAADVLPQLDQLITEWYEWLESLPEFEQFFPEQETLNRVRGMQHDYWITFWEANVDEAYVEARSRVGKIHGHIGLPLHTYQAGMNMFMHLFGRLIQDSKLSNQNRLATSQSLTKLLFLDTAIVIDAYNRLIEQDLTAQSNSLMEMSTPVTQIWSGILLLPIVGIIDSKRARDVMNATLAKISETQARIFILDISGVGVVDTAVANHLVKITKATRLMGCESTISGVSPAIAQTMVDLGIDVGQVKTTATMKDALADAFHRVGMTITKTG
jgi:rsbT co-antagonist protein RsbR